MDRSPCAPWGAAASRASGGKSERLWDRGASGCAFCTAPGLLRAGAAAFCVPGFKLIRVVLVLGGDRGASGTSVHGLSQRSSFSCAACCPSSLLASGPAGASVSGSRLLSLLPARIPRTCLSAPGPSQCPPPQPLSVLPPWPLSAPLATLSAPPTAPQCSPPHSPSGCPALRQFPALTAGCSPSLSGFIGVRSPVDSHGASPFFMLADNQRVPEDRWHVQQKFPQNGCP